MSGFVTCSRHNTRRKANYCEEVPIYDADHKVISHTYVCKSDSACSSAKGGGTAAGASPANQSHNSPSSVQAGAGKGSDAGPLIFNASSSRIAQTAGPRRGNSANSSTKGQGGSAEMPVSLSATIDTLFSVSFTRNTPASATTATETAATGKNDSNEEGGTREHEVNVDATSSDEDASERGSRKAGGGTPVPAPATPTPTVTTAPRTQTRYYDASTGGGGTAGGALNAHHHHAVRKVCWNCGLSGHEKPDCPNTLCRSCHDLRTMGQYHQCTDIGGAGASPFLLPPTSLPFTHPSASAAASAAGAAGAGGGGFDAVRCTRCMRYGHMDCGPTSLKGLVDNFARLKMDYISAAVAADLSTGDDVAGGSATQSSEKSASRTVSTTFTGRPTDRAMGIATPLVIGGVSVEDIVTFQKLSCCFCAAAGHNGYDCNQRERKATDWWVERNMNSRRGGGGLSDRNPSGQFQHHGGSGSSGGFDPRQQRGAYSGNSAAHNSYPSHDNGNSRQERRRPREEERRWSGRDASPSDYRQPDYRRHSGGRNPNEQSGRGVGAGYSARDSFHTSPSYQNSGSNDRYSNRHDDRHGGGHWGNNRDRGYDRPREQQGHSRRGGRRGYSGFSDEDDLY